jgi:hypothetical protein
MKEILIDEISKDDQNTSIFLSKNYALWEEDKGWSVRYFSDMGIFIAIKIKQGAFFISGQYLSSPIKVNGELSADEELNFLNKLIFLLKRDRICDFVAPPLHFSVFNSVPKGSYYTDLGILRINLRKNDDELMSEFSPHYRNKIRKSVSEGLTVDFSDTYFDDLYSLYSTHEKQAIYFDTKEELRNIVTKFGSSNCAIAAVKKGNQIFGCVLILFSQNEALYFHSGTIDNCPYPGANKLLHFEIMKWLKKRNVKYYYLGGYRKGDISGTKYDGIQKFKMRFGPELISGFHFYTNLNWRYSVYKVLLSIYLNIRGMKQDFTGYNYRHKI